MCCAKNTKRNKKNWIDENFLEKLLIVIIIERRASLSNYYIAGHTLCQNDIFCLVSGRPWIFTDKTMSTIISEKSAFSFGLKIHTCIQGRDGGQYVSDSAPPTWPENLSLPESRKGRLSPGPSKKFWRKLWKSGVLKRNFKGKKSIFFFRSP